jgi:hypothetical protein
MTNNEFHAPKAIRYNSVVPSAPTDLAVSALLLERVTITPELVWANVFFRFGLLAAEDSGIFRDFNVNGEIFSFVATPPRVYKTEELADVIAVGHDIDRGDVKGWMRHVQRAEERFERAFWVPRGILGNINVTSVLFQSKGTVRR